MCIYNLLENMKVCNLCSFQSREFAPVVPKQVNNPVKIMFIGENPSWGEGISTPLDECSKSGQSFKVNYLEKLELSKELVWITNIIKCRYPKGYDKKLNKHQTNKNAKICSSNWLRYEIEYVNPKIIVTMSSDEVYDRFKKVFNLRITKSAFNNAVGKAHLINIDGRERYLFPMLHPDSISGRNPLKRKVYDKWYHIHCNEHIPRLIELINSIN